MFKVLQLGYTVLQELCILLLLIDFNHSSQLQEEIHIAAKRIRTFSVLHLSVSPLLTLPEEAQGSYLLWFLLLFKWSNCYC